MTDRWYQIKELLDEALARAPADRTTFVARACGGDDALREEVEALIAADDQARTFLGQPGALEPVEKSSELAPGQRLRHFEVLSPLGAGGMGEVYLARDTHLRRRVALKLLPICFGADPDRVGRFKLEARAAAQLAHPNVCVIHEVGETEEGRHFIAMEYVEGETLRARMARRRMDLLDALDVARQIASALAAAHASRIVHRDVKPENVMLLRPDGYAKVLDFGLAKRIEWEEVGEWQTATRPLVQTDSGMVMGTVAYMSPEQARGQVLDARTDLWSLGVVLYEMVAGGHPFTGETAADFMASILRTEPAPLSAVAPEAPSKVARIVSRLLRKSLEERYQTATTLALDLEQVREEVAFARRRMGAGAPEAMEVTTILQTGPESSRPTELLPTQIDGPGARVQTEAPPDADREAFIDRIKRRLFSLEQAKRIPRSVFLNAYSLCEDGERNEEDGPFLDLIWQLDRGELADQDFVDCWQQCDSERLENGGTADPEAYRLYLQGKELHRRFNTASLDPRDLERAISLLQQAIDVDPDFALGHSALGACYVGYVEKGMGGPAYLAEARAALERALELRPKSVEPRVLLVYVYWGNEEPDRARLLVETLRREAPNNSPVRAVSITYYRLQGRYDEALREIDRWSRVSPSERILTAWNKARILMYRGAYEEAAAEIERGRSVEPNHALLRLFLGQIRYYQGRLDEASELFEGVFQEAPGMRGFRPMLGMVYSARGEHAESRQLIDESVMDSARADFDVAYWLASFYAVEGEHDQALAWLERAIRLGNENFPWFERDPNWNRLRSDDRYIELIRRMKAERRRM